MCHSVSDNHPTLLSSAPRFNLDNDDESGRVLTNYSVTLRPGPASLSTIRWVVSCGEMRARWENPWLWLVCVSIGWSLEDFVTRISSHQTRDPSIGPGAGTTARQSPHTDTKWLETSQTRSIAIICRQTGHGNKRKWIGNQNMPEHKTTTNRIDWAMYHH